MAAEELEGFRDRFNEITANKEPVKTKRLVQLMNDLEKAYDIPMLYSAAYANNNPEVMRLYKDASYARNI